MRLLAIDALAGARVPKDDLRRALDAAEPTVRAPLFVRAAPYLEAR
jgi:hypothetical protein